MENQIIFTYCNERCHAMIIDKLIYGDETYIGKMEVDNILYEIYNINGIIFNPFGFVAIKVN